MNLNKIKYGITAAIILFILGGCELHSGNTKRELQFVRTGEKSLVLIRVQASIENEVVAPFSDGGLIDDGIHFGVGSFNTGGRLKRFNYQKFISPESRQNGWTFLELAPGTYYLISQPPRHGNMFTYLHRFKKPPHWKLEIPEDTKIIYAGTLQVDGVGGFQIFGDPRMREITNLSVDDIDREWATDLAKSHFPDLGEPQVILLEPYDGSSLRFHAPVQPAK